MFEKMTNSNDEIVNSCIIMMAIEEIGLSRKIALSWSSNEKSPISTLPYVLACAS